MLKEFILEKFQGPLDLLLGLIDEAKLAITEVSLGSVTEQFFKYLTTLGADREDELADFLVIGTKLVYLKSKELLPYLTPEADEGPSLADQLKLYRRYAVASKNIAQLWNQNLVAYEHIEPPPKLEGFFPPPNARPDILHQTFTLLLRRLKPVSPLPEMSIDRTQSVKQKVQSLYELLQKVTRVNFTDLLSQAANKSEVIVSFLALLELVKQAKISVRQMNAFGELEIQKV